jgi:hypothetical protein
MAIALGMVGTGTVLLIWGLIQRSNREKTDGIVPQSGKPTMAFALFPVRKGVAAGAVFRW